MSIRLETYFKELSYELTLSNELYFDDEVISGEFKFIDYDKNDENFVVASVDFYIFESIDLNDFYYKADCISADLEYVAANYCKYVQDSHLFGNHCIIDNFKILQNKIDKFDVIRFIIKRITRIFSTFGVSLILLQSKSIILNCDIEERINLLQCMLEIGFIPISEDVFDIVMFKSLIV